MSLVAVVVLIVLLVLVAAAAVAGARWWTWRPVTHQRVMVQLDTGHTLEGIAFSQRGPLLVLDDVTVHAEGGQQAKADGRAVVERRRVLWIQVM